MALDPTSARLDGKVAVVTGAAQGIGEAVAISFAAFGADVAICDRNVEGMATTAKEIEALGHRALTGELDVRDGGAVESFLADVAREFGRVDILVNNAGGTFQSWFMEVSPRGQTALVDENFTSVTHFVRGCVPLMTDGGSIINITSVEAFRAAPGFAVYAAMKAGVEQLSRSLALELADRRIRVNTIAPDVIPTPGDAGLSLAVEGEAGNAEPSWSWKIPLGIGRTDDCAGAAVFLASGLSRFVTGSTVHVDGGSNAARGWRRHPGATHFET